MTAAEGEFSGEYASAVAYLLDRINYERAAQGTYDSADFRLGRMRAVLAELGDPHLSYPVVHIAGTKGKGSVAWYVAETLRRSGRATGLYTSPHLLKLEERFAVNGVPCSEAELADCVREIRPAAERVERRGGGRATFFELTTAISFLLFAKRAVDVAVIEVGMGGRLDCTNVCSPSVCVVTSISFDHEAQLGHTISAIAGEKAGIIKHGVPVASGVRHPDAAAVIAATAADRGCELRQIGIDFDARPCPADAGGGGTDPPAANRFDYAVDGGRWPNSRPRFDLAVRMIGEHQKDNAAVAVAAVDLLCGRLGWRVDDAHLAAAFRHTQVPARMQRFPGMPEVLVDAGHNVASIEALVRVLQDNYPPAERRRPTRTIVYAASADKDYPAILRQLFEVCDLLIITQYRNNPRSVDWNRLHEVAAEELDAASAAGRLRRPVGITKAATSAEAFRVAKESTDPGGLVCVTGSFFLAAEVLPLIEGGAFPTGGR